MWKDEGIRVALAKVTDENLYLPDLALLRELSSFKYASEVMTASLDRANYKNILIPHSKNVS